MATRINKSDPKSTLSLCLLSHNHLTTMAAKLKLMKNCLLRLSAAVLALLILWSLQPKDLNKRVRFANGQWNGTRAWGDGQSRTVQMNGKEEGEARTSGLKSCFHLPEIKADGKELNHVFFLKVSESKTEQPNLAALFIYYENLSVHFALTLQTF